MIRVQRFLSEEGSYDGSTLVARTEDSCNGEFTPKKFIVVRPEDQPRHYKAVISGFETDLPDNPRSLYSYAKCYQ